MEQDGNKLAHYNKDELWHHYVIYILWSLMSNIKRN